MPRATKQPVGSQRSGCTTRWTTTKQKPWQRVAGFRFNATVVHRDGLEVPARLNSGWFLKSGRQALTDGKTGVRQRVAGKNTVNAESRSRALMRGNPALRVERGSFSAWISLLLSSGCIQARLSDSAWIAARPDAGNRGALRRLPRIPTIYDNFLLKQQLIYRKSYVYII